MMNTLMRCYPAGYRIYNMVTPNVLFLSKSDSVRLQLAIFGIVKYIVVSTFF